MTGSAPIRTTCPYCGVGCGLVVTEDGTIAGDPEHPANRGRVCSKGAALGATLGHEGRLLRPQIDGREVGWDAALDRIAGEFANAIAAFGPDAVALYVSGQFLTEDYYLANKLMKGFIGSANIDTNSRLCMASSVAGHIRAFGEDIVPGCYEDIEAADLVVLVGSNLAWCHPVLYQRLAAAKEARRTRVVAIDPRRTATCEIADLHLALRPGSDVAVFAGLLAHLAETGACGRAWTRDCATGFDQTLAAARETAPSLAAAAAIADVPARDLARFYDWFAASERCVTVYSQGVNQSAAGTDKVNAIVNCHLATGRIGKPGAGPFSVTGQPNAMGGREVGGLANQLAAHMGFEPDAIDRVRRFWDAPRIAERPGLKAVELFDALRDGRVKALWILGTNPAASMPRAGLVREALAACRFVAVSDCWPTDTTRLADVVLPAATWGEKDGTVTNSERCISRQRGFRPPPGEARPDWWALSEVARRMGWGRAFAYRGAADIFREHAALSSFENDGHRRFDIGALAGLSDAEYDRLDPVQWPLPRGQQHGTPRIAAFATADGGARCVPIRYRPPAQAANQEWPLVLNTGRERDQWHTMTRTGRVPRLMTHAREPFLDIHPADAERLGLIDGGLGRVESRHGATVLRVRAASGQRRGEVFAAMHWTDEYSSAGPIARLVGAVTDPVSGQPELKATPVRVAPVAAFWHGFLLSRSSAPPPDGPYYWARAPLGAGHGFALAGWESLPSGPGAARWIGALLGMPAEAELVIYADPSRGVFRYGAIVGGQFDACLFLARRAADLPPCDALAPRLGRSVPPGARLALLGGQPGAEAQAARGRVVCACFAVEFEALRRAIADGGMTSVAEIGTALRAGTNCGSCVPELQAMLRRCQGGRIAPAPDPLLK